MSKLTDLQQDIEILEDRRESAVKLLNAFVCGQRMLIKQDGYAIDMTLNKNTPELSDILKILLESNHKIIVSRLDSARIKINAIEALLGSCE